MSNNWIYNGKEVKSIDDLPPNTHSFIYLITNLSNGKRYIGKKQVVSVTRPLIKESERKKPEFADRRKKRKLIIKESRGWKTYIGSNKELIEDVNTNGHTLEKVILITADSKALATYYETKYQFSLGVLETKDEFYNDNILGKFYRKIFDSEEVNEDE